jgi:hypothetical protein
VARKRLPWLLSLDARRDRALLGLVLAGLLSIAFAVTNSADPRYLVPAIGLLALLAGLTVERALLFARGRLPVQLRDLRLAPVWCLAACVAVMWTSVGYISWW